jgi:hypothetical protein
MDEEAEAVETKLPGPPRRATQAPQFVMRFPAPMIQGLVAACATDPREAAALAAGSCIAAGSRDRRHFEAIFEWKTRGRGRSRPALNGDHEIADALDLAVAARTERAAIAVLTGLSGVDVPVASAVMTAIDPGRFTIIDFRALWSLRSMQRPPYPVPFYLEYLRACRRIANEAGVSLRTLDKALWKYSDDNQLLVG